MLELCCFRLPQGLNEVVVFRPDLPERKLLDSLKSQRAGPSRHQSDEELLFEILFHSEAIAEQCVLEEAFCRWTNRGSRAAEARARFV